MSYSSTHDEPAARDLRDLRALALPGPWELAKGGRSINTGAGGKIRGEAHPQLGPTWIYLLAAHALIPRLYSAAEELIQAVEALGIDPEDTDDTSAALRGLRRAIGLEDSYDAVDDYDDDPTRPGDPAAVTLTLNPDTGASAEQYQINLD